jgi:xanthine dehydrogenase YagR molybdenum-binding subunit
MSKHAPYVDDGPLPETPAAATPDESWQETKVIGQPLPRIDAYERVSGSAVYPSDLILPDMLFAAILRCPHPHARVLEVDTSEASAMPGVAEIIDPSSPEAETGWRYGGHRTTLIDPVCRYEGEVVAAVAAETQDQAQDALRAIKVTYEVLPFVADETRALEEGAPAIHEGGNLVGDEPSRYHRGDVEKGFAAADVVLESTYRTDCEIHNPLERHGCVARWEGDRLTVWESSQGVFSVQLWLSSILGLPLANVRVIGTYMGGGFGSKLQPGKYTVLAALLAKRAGRPVKLILSREECLLAVGNRPPSHMWLKAGVKRDGTLTALDFTCTGTGGAFPAGGTSLVDWEVKDLYACDNVRTECTDVYINAGPARPFRAPGHPQGAWALEQMIDALAEAIDMDPVALRLKNLTSVSQANDGRPYTSTGLKDCLERGANEFGWTSARKAGGSDGHIRRGVGVAACHWIVGGGGPPSTLIVKMYSDGSVNLNMGASDLGTGTRTVMAMVVAEELAVAPEQIQVENADTGTTQFATSSGGSKTVPTESPATRAAAIDVKRQLLEIAAEELETEANDLRLEAGKVVSRTDPDKQIAVNQLAGLQRRRVLIGVGYRGPNPEGKVVNPFAAQFCEVEVNTRTGEVKVLRFVAAHDSGRMLNRLTYRNQVCGGITMGIGFGMTEVRTLDRQTGKMVNRNLHDYKMPTALDVPAEVTPVVIDLNDTEANTTGAKGLGEPVTIPTAAAIANAVYDAIGVRVTETPINPTQMCRLLAQAEKEG